MHQRLDHLYWGLAGRCNVVDRTRWDQSDQRNLCWNCRVLNYCCHGSGCWNSTFANKTWIEPQMLQSLQLQDTLLILRETKIHETMESCLNTLPVICQLTSHSTWNTRIFNAFSDGSESSQKFHESKVTFWAYDKVYECSLVSIYSTSVCVIWGSKWLLRMVLYS